MTLANSLRIRSVNVRLPLATLLLSGVVLLAAAIAIAWFAGNGFISAIFQQLDSLQQNPPMWATTPMMLGHYVLVWTVSLMLLVLVIMRVSPQPVAWSRLVVVGILGVLTVRYVMWRSVSTLNLDTPLNGVFSLGLFFLEMLLLVNGKATRLLKQNGVKVGLLGAKLSAIGAQNDVHRGVRIQIIAWIGEMSGWKAH